LRTGKSWPFAWPLMVGSGKSGLVNEVPGRGVSFHVKQLTCSWRTFFPSRSGYEGSTICLGIIYCFTYELIPALSPFGHNAGIVAQHLMTCVDAVFLHS
jgi:hypothetical protein